MWSRKEEFFNDTFRPASIVKIRSGLDDAGKSSSGGTTSTMRPRGAEQIYAIPTTGKPSTYITLARRAPIPLPRVPAGAGKQ